MGRKLSYNKINYGLYKTRFERIDDEATAETGISHQKFEMESGEKIPDEEPVENVEEVSNMKKASNKENDLASYYANALERLYEIYESKKSN